MRYGAGLRHGSVPIRRNATLTLTLNPNFGETGFGETGRHPASHDAQLLKPTAGYVY